MSVRGEFRRYGEKLVIFLEDRSRVDPAVIRGLKEVMDNSEEDLSEAAAAVLALAERSELVPEGGLRRLEIEKGKESADRLVAISRIILGR